MPINPSTIIDTATTLLEAALTDPPPQTVRKYAEPTVVGPEICPFLGVWCEVTDYDLLTGGAGVIAYGRKHNMTATWCVSAPDTADTGGATDPAIVQALDATAETIAATIAGWTAGFGGFGTQLVVTLKSRRLEPRSGSVWQASVLFEVEDDS